VTVRSTKSAILATVLYPVDLKVFTAALVMQQSGDQKIEDTVGVDATGQVFNSITAVEQSRGKEMNPFVNPGAIATVGNVKGSSPDDVWNKILQIHSDFAGRQLDVNQPVYKSESETNQRNRAISSLMSAYERFPMDPAVAVDLYTRQCSINVSARSLSHGRNTGVRRAQSGHRSR
jgi:glutaminase